MGPRGPGGLAGIVKRDAAARATLEEALHDRVHSIQVPVGGAPVPLKAETLKALLPVILLPALLATLTLASHAAVGAQESVNVTSSKLVLDVYGDGAVQLHYTAHAVLTGQQPPQPGEAAAGSITVSYESSITASKATTKLKAAGSLEGGESEKPVHMTGTLHIRYRGGYGTITFVLTGSSGAETFNITMRDAEVRSVDGRVIVTGYIYVSPVSGGTNKTMPLPSEINAALVQQGITYLRVLSLNQTVEDGRLKLGFTVELDLKALAEKLSEGLEPKEARKLRQLLSQSPPVKSYNVDASLTLHGVEKLLEFSFNLQGRVEGNMTEYIEYSRELSTLLSQVQQVQQTISLPKGGKVPEELMALVMLQRALRNPASGKLVPVPPSNSKLTLNIEAKGDRLVVDVSYTSHRQTVPGVGEPAERAEKTLTILSMGISYYREVLQSLAALVPGVEKLIPATVELRAASPNVKLSETRVPIDELPTVNVEIVKAKTGTAAKTATATTAAAKAGAAATETAAAGAAGAPSGTAASASTQSKATLALAVSAATLAAIAALLLLVLRRR